MGVEDGIAAVVQNQKTSIVFGGLPIDTHWAVELFSALGHNTALRTLDVSGCRIRGYDAFLALADALRANTTLTHLNLENNDLTTEDALLISAALDDNDTLVSLGLELNTIAPEVKDEINTKIMLNTQPKVLKHALPRIVANDPRQASLVLSDEPVAEFDKTFQILAEYLKTNSSLKEFYVSNSRMDDYDTSVIAAALTHNQGITKLDMSCNSIGSRGSKDLALALEANTTLTWLDMHSNKVGHVVADFVRALKTNDTLRFFNLEGNGISAKQMEGFEHALKLNHGSLLLKRSYYGCLDNDPALVQVDFGYESLQKQGWMSHCAQLLAQPLARNTHVRRLSFANCVIGDAGCEYIAAIIKSNKFIDEINLPNNNISTTGAQVIGEALASNQSLTDLNFANNRLYDPAIEVFLKSLEVNNSLVSLNVENNYVGEATLSKLKSLLLLNQQPRALKIALPRIRENDATLSTLDFSKQDGLRYHNMDSAKILAEALKENKSLTRVVLSGNTIGAQGAVYLGEALSANRGITTLDVTDNAIQNKGAMALAKGLKYNVSLTSLNLEGNSIGDEGAKAFIEMFRFNNKIKEIRLALGNKIAPQILADIQTQCNLNSQPSSLKQVQSRLRKGDTTMANLDFSNYDGARYYTDESIAILVDELRGNADVVNLNLSNNAFGASGARALASILADNDTLTEVELAQCPIGDAGAEAIADAVRSNTSITRLNLTGCGITDRGLQALVHALQQANDSITELPLGDDIAHDAELMSALRDALEMNAQPKRFKDWEPKLYENNPSLTELNFSNMGAKEKLNDTSAQILSNALKKNDYITRLNIANNSITSVGAAALATMLHRNSALTEINMNNNTIRDTGARALLHALAHNDKVVSILCANNGVNAGLQTQLEEELVLNRVPIALKRVTPKLRANDATLTHLAFQGPTRPGHGQRLFDNFSIGILCQFLAKNTHVQSIDLQNNHIAKAGAVRLADIVRRNATLHTLLLSGNKIERGGAEALIAALKANITLRRLEVEQCGVPVDLYEELTAIIKINNTQPEPRRPLSASSLGSSSPRTPRLRAHELLADVRSFNSVEYYAVLEDDILSDALRDRRRPQSADCVAIAYRSPVPPPRRV